MGDVIVICYGCAGARIFNGIPCCRCHGTGINPNP